MTDKHTFNDGMRAYRRGEYARAARVLSGLLRGLTRMGSPNGRSANSGPPGDADPTGRLAKYYCGMAWRALGVESLQAGDFKTAEAHLRQAVKLLGKTIDLGEHLLAAYAGRRDFARCAAEADRMAELRPNALTPQVRLAQSQWQSGQRPLAMATLTGALRHMGDRCELHLQLGLFHAAEDNHDQAATHLRQAVEADCTCARAWRYLGLVEAARGEMTASAEALQRACVLDDSDLMSLYQLCLAADAAARSGWKPTLKLPSVAPVAAGLSHLRQLGEYAAGEPDFLEALLSLGEAQDQPEFCELMVHITQAAVAGHPRYADLNYYASVAAARAGRAEQALAHARKAVELNGRYVKALVHLGELEAQSGALGEAIAHFRGAVEAGGDWPDLHVRLAELLRQAGQTDQAARHYGRALELNRSYGPAVTGAKSLAA
jgi:tetratricopeptide (TPR) repeat protein